MRVLSGLATLFVALVLCSCARQHATPPQTSPPARSPDGTNAAVPGLIITPVEGVHGKVSSINLNLRFVVLTFPIGQMPALHQHLNVYRKGLKVAELNVTGPQRDESIVADITTGDAAVGDEVRSN